MRLHHALALALLAAPMSAGATSAPARDGNIAIAEELDAARKAATVEAYDLFIARHPRHPLRETAEKERAALLAKRL